MSYDIGQMVHTTAVFKVGAVLTDPTATTLTIKDPAGVVTTPSPIRDSVGTFHYDVLATLAGTYWYTYLGTGVCAASAQARFDVEGGHTT